MPCSIHFLAIIFDVSTFQFLPIAFFSASLSLIPKTSSILSLVISGYPSLFADPLGADPLPANKSTPSCSSPNLFLNPIPPSLTLLLILYKIGLPECDSVQQGHGNP